MDPQLPQPEGPDTPDQPLVPRANSPPRPGRAGRRPRPLPDFSPLGMHVARVLKHFFPQLNDWFDEVPEPRNPRLLVYHRRHLIWQGLVMFLLHLASRHQWSLERFSAGLTRNLTRLAQTAEDTLAHSDTLVRYLVRVPAAAFAELIARLLHRLIRMRTLDGFRVQGHLLVAVDGTEIWSGSRPHCPFCLRRRVGKDGLQYYHATLEAKLVTDRGLALSMATEFVQNDEQRATEELSEEQRKQDCERKAFPRLAHQLARGYPQTAICLLLDALHATQPTIGRCEKHGWKFIVTFKEGSAPACWAEAVALAKLQASHHPPRKVRRPDGTRAAFTWATDVPFGPYRLGVIWCHEVLPDGTERTFAWLTNFVVDAEHVVELADGGGRLRWKIENEGFREQKHGGFALEHVYCRYPTAAQSLYRLLQIAHLFQQLVWEGDVLKGLKPALKTVRNFVRRLTAALHHATIPPADQMPPLGQVRWYSG